MAKRALCIGINDYPGTNSDLSGCVNDATDWADSLTRYDFSVEQLLDREATKEAMYNGIRQLVQQAHSGDTVVITYSGHGSWIPDLDKDEPDERDEVLCPYDISKNRPLTDDELYDIFAERERGVRIVMIADSCHSGSVIRLALTPAEAQSAGRVRFLAPEQFLPPEDLRKAAPRGFRRPFGTSRPFGGVLLAGCQDTEYSYDANFDGRANGAFTYFALKALAELGDNATYHDWYQATRKFLPNQSYPQTPNLGGTRTQRNWEVFG